MNPSSLNNVKHTHFLKFKMANTHLAYGVSISRVHSQDGHHYKNQDCPHTSSLCTSRLIAKVSHTTLRAEGDYVVR